MNFKEYVDYTKIPMSDKFVADLRRWFTFNAGYKSNETPKAVIGISGGKDSSVVAALCAKAIGPENVIGIMMPNGYQSDIDDSIKICNFLGIQQYTINIAEAYSSIAKQTGFPETDQMKTNLPARLRMATLYAVAQSVNGRVIGTSNKSEALLGWGTLWGDTVADFMPIKDLHSIEVVALGKELGLLEDLVIKPPADGMCGKTDEEKFGFTYQDVYDYFYNINMITEKPDIYAKIDTKIRNSNFKRQLLANIPHIDKYFGTI